MILLMTCKKKNEIKNICQRINIKRSKCDVKDSSITYPDNSQIQWLSLFDEFVIIYIFSIDSSGWERTHRQLTSQELYIKIDVPYSLHAKAFVARNRP